MDRDQAGDRLQEVRLAALAVRVASLAPDEHLVIGEVAEAATRLWAAPTRTTRFSAERRDHIFITRPAMASLYAEIIAAVRDPDEIHRYPGNPRSATLWRLVDPTHYIQVAVFMREHPALDNSVITAIYSRAREIVKRRNQGLLVWERQDQH